ncbi:MAG: TonB-dependent receptor [Verrucomicrobia bacterium]|nr:TonB-dependent receptor [Verrucomicrobiota bacterium]
MLRAPVLAVGALILTALCMLMACAAALGAETDTTTEPTWLDTVFVTATRMAKAILDTPNTVQSLTSTDIQARTLSRSTPEALREMPGVMVQKTSNGQGSPYMRGFTGFRTLFLLDGIRLNNSVFRDGPNQYWNTVDPFSISRLEVVKGPGSVTYGNDAIGGTVNAISRGPEGYGDGLRTSERLFYRVSSAENSHIARFDFDLTQDADYGLHVGGTWKQFGDVEAGGDVGRQRKTGYDEWDADLKFEYFLDPDTVVSVAHQHVDLDDAWRTHKTIYGISWKGTTIGDELERSLDQSRGLTAVQYHSTDRASFIDAISASLSYHVQEESQFRIRTDERYDRQGFDVGTVGASIQLETPSAIGRWAYGIEYYHDDVDSFADKLNADGSVKSSSIQGPVADDATYGLLGVFVEDDVQVHDKVNLIFGARYTYASVDAGRVEDPITGGAISLDETWDTAVGSARVLYALGEAEQWRLFGGVSQGVRAPNLSDLTRLDTARSNEIETPSPNLDPEQFISYEIGIKGATEACTTQLAWFYTDISNMIVRTPTGRVIDESIEVTKRNAGDGYVQGVELSASYRFHPQLNAVGSVAWTDGEVDAYPTSEPVEVREPLSRLMPTTGILGLHWDHPAKGCWAEALVTIADRQDDLSSDDRRDTQRIPPDGTPGYTVLTVRGGWEVARHFTVTAAVENVTDEEYRIHGSGQNEPGRSFVLALDYTF